MEIGIPNNHCMYLFLNKFNARNGSGTANDEEEEDELDKDDFITEEQDEENDE